MDLVSSVAKSIGGFANKAKETVKDILSPPRTKYDPKSIPLVLQTGELAPFDQNYVRTPIEFKNKRGQKIVGSLYNLECDVGKPLKDCLIYLHGVSSSQLEGQFLVPNFCLRHISVFCWDFAGCGCSEGRCISLGYFEHQDCEEIIEKLSSEFGYQNFALWGRSMGAATALLVKSPFVKCAVIDSAYTSVEDIMSSIADSYYIPRVALIGALKLYIASIFETPFNIDDVSPLKNVKSYEKFPFPCAFGHAKGDEFVPYEQGRLLFDSMKSDDKEFKVLSGGHNSKRDTAWIRYGVAFILNHWGYSYDPDSIEVCECRKLQEGTEQFASFAAMMANKRENESKEAAKIENTPKEKGKDKQNPEEKKENTPKETDKDNQNPEEKKEKTKTRKHRPKKGGEEKKKHTEGGEEKKKHTEEGEEKKKKRKRTHKVNPPKEEKE